MQLIPILFLAATSLARANNLIKYDPADQVQYAPAGRYESGSMLLAQAITFDPSIAPWSFIEVPFDYQNPAGQKISVSYLQSPGFSNDKPTVIYFNGGPGGNSVGTNFTHLMKDVNVIYFNQRGAFYSRPDNKQTFLDPQYYSSENTARDALSILNFLKIDQVTVYGHSYGTVPATIFANLFPDQTRSAILEGTIFSGEVSLWNTPHKLKLAQKIFDRYPKELQNKILYFSQAERGNPFWFSQFVRSYMYSEDFQDRMQDHLETLLSSGTDTEILTQLAAFKPANEGEKIIEYDTFSSVMQMMISCKELNADQPGATFNAVFVENKFVVQNKSRERCTDLGIPIELRKTYYATDYPIQKPVYYFQGTTDGATTADFAIRHFKQAAKGPAYLMLAKNAGHIPILESLMLNLNQLNNIPNDRKAAVAALFTAAVRAEKISPELIQALNKDYPVQWVMTAKGQ